MNQTSISWSFFLTSKNFCAFSPTSLVMSGKKRNVAVFPLYLFLLPVSRACCMQHLVPLQIAVKVYDNRSRWMTLVRLRCQGTVQSLDLIFSQVYSRASEMILLTYSRSAPLSSPSLRPTRQRLRRLSLLAASCMTRCRSLYCLALCFISLDSPAFCLQIQDSRFSLIKPLINGSDS